jgi:hypothetical protein
MPTKATGTPAASAAAPTLPTIDPAVFEETAQRIRDLNERLIDGSKKAGMTSLEAYEKALTGLLAFEGKVAGASQIEWVSALATTHATFIQDISAAYTKAARELLS